MIFELILKASQEKNDFGIYYMSLVIKTIVLKKYFKKSVTMFSEKNIIYYNFKNYNKNSKLETYNLM